VNNSISSVTISSRLPAGLIIPLIYLFASLFFAVPAISQSNPPPHQPPYPAHWWTPVDPKTAPAWEVLPQAAAYGEVILSKRNELGILSNFASTPFEYRGKKYASVEGFWQGTKFPENEKDPRATYPGLSWPLTRIQVDGLTGFEAKDAGNIGSENMKKMGIDWVTFEGRKLTYKQTGESEFYKLVVEIMSAKLLQNPKVKEILVQTGDLKLRPDHDSGSPDLKAWQYHQIWMAIRARLHQLKN